MNTDTIFKSAKRVIEIEQSGLNMLHESIDQSFADVIQLIYKCKGRVIITGIGKSGHIGVKTAATLASTGTSALFLHATEAAHGDLGMIDAQDIVIAISNSGSSQELVPIIQYCKRYSIPLVAVTANVTSQLANHADYILKLPDAEEACPLSLAPMTSTTMTLVLGDALAATLLELKGFAREDFAKFHPGGKLGAQLKKLSELLDHDDTLSSVPFVQMNTPLRDVVLEITNGRRGMVAVKNEDDRTSGVITDGDLRRGMFTLDINEAVASDLMSANPIKISENALVAEAIRLCEQKSVNALFVTGYNERIRGVVHLQDLLKSGAV